MPQFHETGYGRTYYEYQLPELTRQLKRIADALEKQNELTEKNRLDKQFKGVKFLKPTIHKRSDGDWNLKIEGDVWLVYKDKYSLTTTWRAECTEGLYKNKNTFRESSKTEVKNNIYNLYDKHDDASGIPGETGSGDQ